MCAQTIWEEMQGKLTNYGAIWIMSCNRKKLDRPTCAPVLETGKHAFQSLVRQGAELRHCKNVLPNPKKPDIQHYQNLVQQNAWIRSNLCDALGNYKYCSACIIFTLGIGSQRLTHQRSVKQREAHIPIVDMSKSSIANEYLEEYGVMPPEAAKVVGHTSRY